MAAAPHEAGRGKLAACGNIKVGSDRKIRPALEDDFLDLVSIALDCADDAGVERSAHRLWSKRLPGALLDGSDIGFSVGLGFQARQTLLDSVLCIANLIDEPFLDHPREAVERRELADRKSTRLNSSHLGISYAV